MTTTEFPTEAARRPVATYRAVSSHDASSTARDGQPVYEVRRLESANSPVQAEILFGDGQWQLCDPDRDLVPAFVFDAFDDHPFLAEEYGEEWNGWDTPVVTKHVVEDILSALELNHRWDGTRAVIQVEDYEDRVEPREDGLYDLRQMGWTVLRVEL